MSEPVREHELLGRRIAGGVLLVGGAAAMYFDEGVVAAIVWAVFVAAVYAAVMRWVPLVYPPGKRAERSSPSN